LNLGGREDVGTIRRNLCARARLCKRERERENVSSSSSSTTTCRRRFVCSSRLKTDEGPGDAILYDKARKKQKREREARRETQQKPPHGEKFERARGEKENDGCANTHVRCQNRSDLAKTQ